MKKTIIMKKKAKPVLMITKKVPAKKPTLILTKKPKPTLIISKKK
jgi:hypothetical protein